MRKKRLDLENARPMDWDEFLYEIPLVGLDFQIMMPVRGIELFRGPMGSAVRVGDEVRFHPNWIVLKRRGEPLTLAHTPQGSDAPSAHLMRSRPLALPDTTIVIVGSGTPLFCFHPRGDNVSLVPVPPGTVFH